MNERFIFTASVGFCLILGYIIAKKLPKFVKNAKTGQSVALGFIIVLTSLYAYKTIDRNKAWKDDFTLFTTDVNTSRGSAKSNCSAGGILVETAQDMEKDNPKRKEYLVKAIGYLTKAVKIHPTYKDALLLLGNGYFELDNQYKKAIDYYLKILKRNPKHENSFNNTLLMLSVINDPEYEFIIYDYLEKIKPGNYDVIYNLGWLHGKHKGDLKKAILYLQKAVNINPNDPRAYKDLGVAYALSGDLGQSINILKKSIAINPEDLNSYKNLIMSLKKAGKQDEARYYAREAQEIAKNK